MILTARDSVRDTVAGLEGGADDYIAKPFAFEESWPGCGCASAATGHRGDHARVGDLTLDLRTRRAHVADRTVDLTAREFALAEVFCRHPDQVLSREQLLSNAWGSTSIPSPTSSTSTSGTCAASSARTGSRRCGAWATGCAPAEPAADERTLIGGSRVAHRPGSWWW